jgi:hypothetical protein
MPQQQAEIIDIKTGRPIGEMVSNVESMVLLSLLASRATVAGADPSAIVSPDHKLLMLCDEIIMRKRQADRAWSEYHAEWTANPGRSSPPGRSPANRSRDESARGPCANDSETPDDHWQDDEGEPFGISHRAMLQAGIVPKYVAHKRW